MNKISERLRTQSKRRLAIQAVRWSFGIVLLGSFCLAASGCDSDPQSPPVSAPNLQLATEQGYDLGGLIYVSTIGFKVYAVPGDEQDVVAVEFCAAREILEEGGFGEPMTVRGATTRLAENDLVQVRLLTRFFNRVESDQLEDYGLAYPEMGEFFSPVATRGGDDPPPCPNCPECNEPPCDQLTMMCLKQCYLPSGG